MSESNCSPAVLSNPTTNRITPEMIDHHIEYAKKISYHVFPDTTMTVVCVTLPNGFNVVGTAACIDPANFSEDTGRHIALDDVRHQLWQLLAFGLMDHNYTNNL